MGTQKGKLFELAEMYHSYTKKNKRKQPRKEKKTIDVKGKHFDDGKSISLGYSLSMYPEALYESHQRQINSLQMSTRDNDQSEAFYVEPFEAEKTVDITYKEEGQEGNKKEAKLDKIVKTDHDEDVSEVEPITQKEQNLSENEKQLDKIVSTEDDDTSTTETELPTLKDKLPGEKVTSAVKADQKPAEKRSAVEPYQASDEEFARDIGEILKGQKVYDAGKKTTVSASGTKPPPALPEKSQAVPATTPAAIEDDVLNPDKNKHKIFEQIAKSMQYANSYDLGAIELEQRFDKMEEAIEQEELNKVLLNNSAAQQKNAPDKDIFEVDKPARKPDMLPQEKFNPKTVLNTTNGGRSITADQLQKGDLVLAASGSDCVAGICISNNKMLIKGVDDKLEARLITDQLAANKVVVALRHINMQSGKGQAIEDFLTKLPTGKISPEKWITVNCPAISIHPEVCQSAEAGDSDKCNTYSGRIYLGTPNNNSFLCAGSIIDAFESNQLGFLSATKEHDGSLKYFGHLKTNA